VKHLLSFLFPCLLFVEATPAAADQGGAWAEAAYASCVAKGIRELDDGKRDPRPLVKNAETRCDAELTSFAREFRGRPWICTNRVNGGNQDGPAELSDRDVAACFVKYLKVLREHRIARLIAYRENHAKY
jgi:hypothetical protein